MRKQPKYDFMKSRIFYIFIIDVVFHKKLEDIIYIFVYTYYNKKKYAFDKTYHVS